MNSTYNLKDHIFVLFSCMTVILFLFISLLVYANYTVALTAMMLGATLILISGHLRLLCVFGFVYGNLIVVFLYEYYKNKYGIDLPYYLGGSDDLHYEVSALTYASEYDVSDYFMIRGGVVPQWHNSPAYVYIVAMQAKLTYFIGGYNTLIPRVYNIFFLVLSSIIAHNFAKNRLLLSKRSSQVVMVSMFSLPLMTYFSAHIYRDVIVTMLFLHIFYLLTAKKLTLLIVFAIVIELAILSQLRFLSFLFMFVFVMIGVFASFKNKYLKLTLVFLVSILLVFLAFAFNILNIFSYYSSSYAEYRLGQTDGMAHTIFSLPLIFSIVPRLLYLSVIPVPNFSVDFVRIFLGTGTVIQMFFMPFFLIASYGVFKGRDKIARKVLLVFSVLYFGLAMTSFAERQLLMLYPFGILILLYGWEKNTFLNRNKKDLALFSAFLVLVLVGFYNFSII